MKGDFYVTGTWENIVEGMQYHGAFQLFLHPDGQKMEGVWVGFDSRNHIQHGWWHWEVLSRQIGKKARARVQELSTQEEVESNSLPLLDPVEDSER
jgi:hypothetical protein